MRDNQPGARRITAQAGSVLTPHTSTVGKHSKVGENCTIHQQPPDKGKAARQDKLGNPSGKLGIAEDRILHRPMQHISGTEQHTGQSHDGPLVPQGPGTCQVYREADKCNLKLSAVHTKTMFLERGSILFCLAVR